MTWQSVDMTVRSAFIIEMSFFDIVRRGSVRAVKDLRLSDFLCSNQHYIVPAINRVYPQRFRFPTGSPARLNFDNFEMKWNHIAN